MSARAVSVALLLALSIAPLAHARATNGTITRVAGTTPGFSGDGGPATQAQLDTPRDIAFLADGTWVIADFNNDRIRHVRPDGTIETVAGDGSRGFAGDGGPAVDAELDRPRGVTALPGGGFLIADTFNNRIRKVAPDGTITTVATGLSLPSDTATTPDGGFLVADTGNDRIEKVALDGTMTTAAAGPLNAPRDVSVASDGSILVADTGDNRIRRIDTDGTVVTVAGNGAPGLSGDGDPAFFAGVDQPFSVAALPHGGFVFADTANSRIRRVTPMGTIFTVAGSTPGDTGDGGLAKDAQLSQPGALTLAPGGGFLVADTGNAQVRRVSDIGAVPPAVPGHSIAIAPGTGSVSVRPAELPGYIALQEEDLVPNGSDVEATSGDIQVTVAQDAGGAQITADLSDGPFRMMQGSSSAPFTDFRVPSLTGCGTSARSAAPRAAAAAFAPARKRRKKHPKPHRLFVRESGGRWRSSTGSTSASAVGTQWHTTLSCGGTRVTVDQGIVRVRDKLRRRNHLLQAGQTFLVKTAGPNRGT
jgi:hypothetical protein